VATDRLQKVLARAGVASRRAAEALITAGRVRVDGRVITELGSKVDARAKIEVDGKRVFAELFVYAVLHKPRNVMSTMSDPEGRPTVREYLTDVPGRAYPVGRLDFSTSGVLLVTNDGDFAEALLHPRKAVPKTYVVKVQGLMQDEDLEKWRRGMRLEDGPTLPARVKMLRHEEGKTWFELTITEGRNQQIRRMGDASGFRVMRLARLGFAGITSEGLAPGRWRFLTHDELSDLKLEWGVPKRLVAPPPLTKEAKPAKRPWPAAGAREPQRDKGHPRYGGGSPGRRDVGVKEDWGGGIRRGSSGARDQESPPRGEVGGRGARTRTTGTGGGIGAGEGSYRVKGRKGW
jgi:23S rRNA pseudouridine2605 synthase